MMNEVASEEIRVDANSRINLSYDDLEKMIDAANNYTLGLSNDESRINNGSGKSFFYEDLN
jgi:hypothetical protein